MCNLSDIKNYYNTSIIKKTVDFIDIQQNSTLLKAGNESFFLKKINEIFALLQNLTGGLTENSLFVRFIDKIIFAIVVLTLVMITFAPTGIIGLLAFMGFGLTLLKMCLTKGEKFTLNTLDLPILIYLGIAILSVTYSYMPLAALKGLAKMLVYFGAYLTFYNLTKNKPHRTVYLLGAVAAVASLEALYCVYQQIHGVEALASWQDLSKTNPEQLMNRVYGTLKPLNPNLLAGYLIASFSSALGAFFYTLSKKLHRLSVFSGIGTLLIMMSIVFTGSRGAYIALTGMIAALIVISGHIIWHDLKENTLLKKIWIYLLSAGILAVVAAIILSPALQHRVLSIFAARGDSSNSFRMNVWISTIKMFLDNWFIGIGTGNTVFRLTYGFYMVTGFDALGAYCVPLEIAAESGIFALMAFLWLLLNIFIKSVKIVHSNTNLEQKIVISSCFIGVLGIMLHGLVDTIFFRPQINIIFWMLVAVFASAVNMKKNSQNSDII